MPRAPTVRGFQGRSSSRPMASAACDVAGGAWNRSFHQPAAKLSSCPYPGRGHGVGTAPHPATRSSSCPPHRRKGCIHPAGWGKRRSAPLATQHALCRRCPPPIAPPHPLSCLEAGVHEREDALVQLRLGLGHAGRVVLRALVGPPRRNRCNGEWLAGAGLWLVHARQCQHPMLSMRLPSCIALDIPLLLTTNRK